MKKRLYVSDLDGTLLGSNGKISEHSCEVLNRLVQQGLIFSYATARSVHTAKKVTCGLEAKIPLIVYNGAFIIDNKSGERLLTNTFTNEQAEEIYRTLTDCGVSPIVYALVDNSERFSYYQSKINDEVKAFIGTRKNDFRNTPLENNEYIMEGEKFYFTCIEKPEILFPVYEKLREKYNCLYQTDIYTGSKWLGLV